MKHPVVHKHDAVKSDLVHSSPEEGAPVSGYTKEELEKFYHILHQYEAGELKTYTVETSHAEIRERISQK